MLQHRFSSRTLLVVALMTTLCLIGGSVRTNAGTPFAQNEHLICSLDQHIYLYTPVGVEPPTGQVDVTDTLYTVDGQDYVVYNDNPIAVSIDDTQGHLYGINGNIIGYVTGF